MKHKEREKGVSEWVSGRGGEPVIRDVGSKRMGAMWRKKIELGSGRNRGLLGAENKVLLTKKKMADIAGKDAGNDNR